MQRLMLINQQVPATGVVLCGNIVATGQLKQYVVRSFVHGSLGVGNGSSGRGFDLAIGLVKPS